MVDVWLELERKRVLEVCCNPLTWDFVGLAYLDNTWQDSLSGRPLDMLSLLTSSQTPVVKAGAAEACRAARPSWTIEHLGLGKGSNSNSETEWVTARGGGCELHDDPYSSAGCVGPL